MSFRLNLDDQVQHLNAPMPLCVSREQSVRAVIDQMQSEKTGNAVIVDGQRPIGIFTERDALKRMAQGEKFDISIAEAMTPDPATIKNDATISEAIKVMSEGGYRRLPIVDEQGHLVSLLKVSQILRYLVEHFPQYIYNLPPTPHHKVTEREGA